MAPDDGVPGATPQREPRPSVADSTTELLVRREMRIIARDGDRLLSGQVDRLVHARRGGEILWADILDFKTDHVAAGDAAALTDQVEYYRPQMAAYRHAVAKMFRLPPDRVIARLLFVEPGVVVDV